MVYLLLLLISVLRVWMAFELELGIDEVYYLLYAAHPDLSYFDHPPFVGWMIRLFTGNFLRDGELFIRLGALLLGTLNGLIFYRIIRLVADKRAALAGILLFWGSIYATVICGVFILPDSSMLTFWLLSLYFLIKIVYHDDHRYVLWIGFGVSMGLAILSKYHSAMIWVGFLSFILIQNRSYLKKPQLYLSGLITILCFSPVIVWNMENDFISFKFHENRIGDSALDPIGMIRELGGAFAYNGPINFILIAASVFVMVRKKPVISSKIDTLLLIISLPLILFFLVSSNWSQTLPHWTSPAYTTLLIPAAVYISNTKPALAHWSKKSFWLIVLLMPLSLFAVRTSFFSHDLNDNPNKLGRNDFTLDLSQWREIARVMHLEHRQLIKSNTMNIDSPLLITRWFPGAHFDFYVAREIGIPVLPIGNLESLHEYYWLQPREPYSGNAYFLTTSHLHQEIDKYDFIKSYKLHKTITLYKGDLPTQNLLIYIVKLGNSSDINTQ